MKRSVHHEVRTTLRDGFEHLPAKFKALEDAQKYAASERYTWAGGAKVRVVKVTTEDVPVRRKGKR